MRFFQNSADDTQLYFAFTFQPNDRTVAELISPCLADASTWMKKHHLNLTQTPSVNNNIIQVRFLQATLQKKNPQVFPSSIRHWSLHIEPSLDLNSPTYPYKHKEAHNHFLKHLLLWLEWIFQFRLYFKKSSENSLLFNLHLYLSWYFSDHVLDFAFCHSQAVVERVLKKHTQVMVPLPSRKCSVSRVKVLVQKLLE